MLVTDKLKAGTIWVNNYRATSFTSPFGGYKDSGIGRESGVDAINEFLHDEVRVDLHGSRRPQSCSSAADRDPCARRGRAMTQALAGIRVLDLSNVLAGPFCAYQLGLLGAEVIKIEVPGHGDLARKLGADPALNDQADGRILSRAKRRQAVHHHRSEVGRRQGVLQRLVGTAHVLVENFRPGVMDRLGLGYEQLREHNPSLVYCAISGFGQDGPMRDAPAYDQIVQGLSGAMSITGDERCAPLRAGYPVADTMGGITAALRSSAR